MVTHTGGCHCGAVRFEVEAPVEIEVQLCNCSICAMASYLHLIVPSGGFRPLSGEAEVITYTFNTGVARHRFCKTCGIKSFYVPRSNPDGVSVNERCLEPKTIERVRILTFDGRQREARANELDYEQADPGRHGA